MSKDIDRIEFYEQLSKCESKKELENIIDNIDNEDLLEVIQDKYKQIIEFNQDEDLKSIIRILEYTYLQFEKYNRN